MKKEAFTKRFKKAIYFLRQDYQITYMEAKEILKDNPLAVLIDVRSKQEYDESHLAGAICIPTYEIASQVPHIWEDLEQTMIVYCQSGARSKKAVSILKKMGYSRVYEMKGGMDNL